MREIFEYIIDQIRFLYRTYYSVVVIVMLLCIAATVTFLGISPIGIGASTLIVIFFCNVLLKRKKENKPDARPLEIEEK